MELIIIAVIAVAVAFVIRTIVLSAFPEVDLTEAANEVKLANEARRRSKLEGLAEKAGGALPAAKVDPTVKQRLERAGLKMTADTYRGLTIISGLSFTAIGMVFALAISPKFGMVPAFVVMILCITGGMALPSYLVSSAEKKRKKEIEASLPQTLELLSITVRAGFPLERAVRLVGERGIGPMAEEFRIVDREVNMLSVPLERSMERMSERCGVQGVRNFVLAVNQSHRQGTSITRVLDSQAQIARSKFYANLLVKVNKLPNKMIPVIFLCFMPILIVMPLVPAIAKQIPMFVSTFPQFASLIGM